jgi:cholesterol transport system auxiliary component
VKTLLPLILALAAGCSLFRGPPPVTYELTAPDSIPQLRSGTAAQIMIPEPRALKFLDSERVVVTTDAKITYYPDAQWTDRLPAVFQAKAIEAFEQSKRARAVGRPGEGLSIDYQLLIDIRSSEYNTSSGVEFARIEISAKILNDRNGRVVSTRVLTSEAPVASDQPEDVVAALDAALNEMLVDLVRWTVSKV